MRMSAKIRIPSKRMTPAEHWERIVKHSNAAATIGPGYAEQQQKALVHLDTARHALDLLLEDLSQIGLITPDLDACCRRLRAHCAPEIQTSDAAIVVGPLKIAA